MKTGSLKIGRERMQTDFARLEPTATREVSTPLSGQPDIDCLSPDTPDIRCTDVDRVDTTLGRE